MLYDNKDVEEGGTRIKRSKGHESRSLTLHSYKDKIFEIIFVYFLRGILWVLFMINLINIQILNLK